MTPHPNVYAIVLNWNGLSFLRESMEALLNQDYDELHVLFVDNGSSDGSAAFIRDNFPKVEIIAFEKNRGFEIPNNIAMGQAISQGADYILLLNNDVVLERNAISELVQAGESDPNIGALGSVQLRYSDPSQVVSAGGTIDWKRCIIRFNQIMPQRNQEVQFMSGAVFMVKRSVIDRVGMLDEEYYFYGEDADWSTRIIRHGYKIVCVATSIARHHVEGSSRNWAFRIYHLTRTRFILMSKHARFNDWLYFIPFFIKNSLFGHFIYLYSRGNKAEGYAIFHAIVDFFLHRVRPSYAQPGV